MTRGRSVPGNSADSLMDREVGLYDLQNAFSAKVLNVHVRFKLTGMRLHKGCTKPFFFFLRLELPKRNQPSFIYGVLSRAFLSMSPEVP